MKQLIQYCALSAIVFLTACQKNKLPKVEETGSPVFYAKCLVNGLPLTLQAGVNDYEMKSTYYVDKNNLYVYKSELAQACSNSCGYQLTILINDNKFSDSSGNSTYTERTLAPGVYAFGRGSSDPLSYIGTFTPLNKSAAATHTWYFSDGSSVKSEIATKIFSVNELITVSLFKKDGNCEANVPNQFKIGSSLQTRVVATKLGPLKYSFSAVTGTNESYTYRWDFGDGTPIVTDRTPEHTYSAQGFYPVTLTLTAGNKDTCVFEYRIPTDGSCEANFIANFLPVPNTNALSAITLQVKDQNGTVYSSNDIQQLASSKFEIISIEDYKPNENNQSTKKVKIKFSCTLKNGATTVNLTDGEATIAAAYK